MNIYPVGSQLNLKSLKPTPEEPVLELAIFSVGNLKLALQTEFIYKLIRYKSVHSGDLNPVSIVHVDNSEVTVINLHQHLFKSSLDEELPAACLMIIHAVTGELYGIPTDDTPILLEVPLSMIRVLPESYRRADTLGIASHVAVLPQPDSITLTVFLMDVDRLLPLPQ